MQEFNHIEALWAKHTVDIKISADEMLKQAKREVNAIRNKSLLNLVGMSLSFVALATLWLFFDFKSWTTHLGLSIVLFSIAVYTIILYNNHRLLAKKDFTIDPKHFILQLKAYQIDRFSLYHKLYWFYAFALSLGMALYFVEVLETMSNLGKLAAIVITFGWIIFCSTLVRKAVIKRDKERIALLIEKFERIGKQFQGQ